MSKLENESNSKKDFISRMKIYARNAFKAAKIHVHWS